MTLDKDGDGNISVCELVCAYCSIKRTYKPCFLRSAARLRFFDVYARFLFPLFYAPTVLIFLAEVNFGIDYFQLLKSNAACL